jgi:hypothetical protein
MAQNKDYDTLKPLTFTAAEAFAGAFQLGQLKGTPAEVQAAKPETDPSGMTASDINKFIFNYGDPDNPVRGLIATVGKDGITTPTFQASYGDLTISGSYKPDKGVDFAIYKDFPDGTYHTLKANGEGFADASPEQKATLKYMREHVSELSSEARTLVPEAATASPISYEAPAKRPVQDFGA